ncbi:MAG: hypothetical protein OXH50_07845, partial [Gemmatimonadetes bacterium]|nr:hypothetical protein [Gemmatimonadota bacterium]
TFLFSVSMRTVKSVLIKGNPAVSPDGDAEVTELARNCNGTVTTPAGPRPLPADYVPRIT